MTDTHEDTLVLSSFKRFTERYLFLMTAVILAVTLVFCVRQIRYAFCVSSYSADPLVATARLTSIVVLVLFYVVTMAVLMKRYEAPRWLGWLERHVIPGFLLRSAGFLMRLLDLTIAWPVVIARRAPSRVRHGAAIFLITLGAAALTIYWTAPNLLRWYLLSDLAVVNVGWMLALLGVWLLFCPADWSAPDEIRSRLIENQGRFIGWVLFTYSLGELIWLVAGLGILGRLQPALGFELYSRWALLQILFLLVNIAIVVDYWNARSRWPVRLVAGFVALCAVIFHTMPANMTVKLRPSPPPSEEVWAGQLLDRLEAMPEGPVVLVSASGGGSRAAMFAGLVLEGMTRQEFLDEHTLADHLLMISSVSGGSLASAYFVAGDGRPSPHCHDLWHSSRDGLLALVDSTLSNEARLCTEKLCDDKFCTGHPAPEDERQLESLASLGSAIQQARDTASTLRAAGHDTSPGDEHDTSAGNDEWVFSHRFMDDMTTDFMAPTLRGILTPMINRGDALEQFWEERFGWRGITSDTIATLRNADRAQGFAQRDAPGHDDHDGRPNGGEPAWQNGPRTAALEGPPGGPVVAPTAGRVASRVLPAGVGSQPPLVLFNTCNTTWGTRVVVGFPPLPKDFFTGAESSELDTFPTQAFSDLDSSLETRLTQAVRLSSNFPWGFRVRNVGDVNLLDGGMVDNTGLDSFYYLFRRLGQSEPGREVLSAIVAKGVLLIEIDAGGKPSGRQQLAHEAAGILEPLNTFSGALYTNNEFVKEFYHEKIQDMLEEAYVDPVEAMLKQAFPNRWEDQSGLASRRPGGVIPPDVAAVQRGFAPIVIRYRFQCEHFPSLGGEDSTEQRSVGTREYQSVMTAWALGDREKARVLTRFLVEWHLWTDQLGELRQVFAQRSVDLRDTQSKLEQLAALDAMGQSLTQIEQMSAQLPPDAGGQDRLVRQMERDLTELNRAHDLLAQRTSPFGRDAQLRPPLRGSGMLRLRPLPPVREGSPEVSVDRRFLSSRAIEDLKREASGVRAGLELNRRRQAALAGFRGSADQARKTSEKALGLQREFDDKSRLVERLAP